MPHREGGETETADSTELILGIDGGGTSTEAWLADRAGKVVGKGRAGASNAKAVGAAASRAALNRAIDAAFDDADLTGGPAASACLGLAGLDHPDDRRILKQWSVEDRWAERFVIVNDGDLVVASGTPEGWGIGVIAGTGSIAVGRSRTGRSARAGGWGHLFGDEGSAYHVVMEAFRRIARRPRRPRSLDRPRSSRDEALRGFRGRGSGPNRLGPLRARLRSNSNRLARPGDQRGGGGRPFNRRDPAPARRRGPRRTGRRDGEKPRNQRGGFARRLGGGLSALLADRDGVVPIGDETTRLSSGGEGRSRSGRGGARSGAAGVGWSGMMARGINERGRAASPGDDPASFDSARITSPEACGPYASP